MEKQKKNKKKTADHCLSRRDFMTVAGAVTIGVGIGGCATSKSKQKNELKIGIKPKIPPKKFSDREDFDVVVIGTGVGGSAAGAIAATYGLKTLILEKNPRPGGMCSYYEKQGFYMDTGVHLFFRENKGPFGEVTRRLGMGTPIEFVKAKNTITMRGINRDFTVPKNPILSSMTMPSVMWQMKINPLHYLPLANMLRKIMWIPEKEIEKLDKVSFEAFLMQYSNDPKILNMFAGFSGYMFILPPWKASAGEVVWNLKNLMKELHVGYPKGGSVAIPKTFLKGAKEFGAEIRMNAGVKKIVVTEGKIDHIILDTGETIKARAIISTTAAKDTILRLVGESYVPESYARQIKAIVPSLTAVQAKLALRKELLASGVMFGMYPKKINRDVLGEFCYKVIKNNYNGEQGEYIPVIATVPTNFDPSLAPPGCQIITAGTTAPTLDMTLKHSPQVWVDGIMKALRALIPNLDENLIFCDTWSVNALAEWTGKSDGSLISTAQVVGQTGKDRICHRTPIKGLYLAGDCAGPARGVCTELACQSGMDCADLVANELMDSLI